MIKFAVAVLLLASAAWGASPGIATSDPSTGIGGTVAWPSGGPAVLTATGSNGTFLYLNGLTASGGTLSVLYAPSAGLAATATTAADFETWVTTRPIGQTLYYNNAVSTSANDLGNWWQDAAHTIPALSLPGVNDLAVGTALGIYMNSGTIAGNAVFYGSAMNGGTIKGNATFTNTAALGGVVYGNAAFYSGAGQVSGSVLYGNAQFNDDNCRLFGGAVLGDALFLGTANTGQSGGVVYGTAMFVGGDATLAGGTDYAAVFSGGASQTGGIIMAGSVANGGTGLTSIPAGTLLYASGANVLTPVALGQDLTVTGTAPNLTVALTQRLPAPGATLNVLTSTGGAWTSSPPLSAPIGTGNEEYVCNGHTVLIPVGGTAFASSAYSGYDAVNAFNMDGSGGSNYGMNFNGGTGTCWLSNNTLPVTLGYHLASSAVVTGYKLLPYGNRPLVNTPSAWTFAASNDSTNGADGTWTTLDTQSGQSTWLSGRPRNYFFTNTTSYAWVRFTFTATAGGTNYASVQQVLFWVGP
jgi:hypothetical protein